MDAKSVEEFQEQIGIKFHEPSRLWNAFIHSSYANERRMSKDKNNERLEFLGDAVLELVTSNYLYRTYQKESEGKLSKIRASLVCEPTLAGCARDINLGKYVLLSKGEDMTGGRSRDSILSDAFEAVIGAIYLDQGIETGYYLTLSEEVRGLTGYYFDEKKVKSVSEKGYTIEKARKLMDYCQEKVKMFKEKQDF